MAVTTYKSSNMQEIADIVLHANAYGITILNVTKPNGFFTIRLQDNLPPIEIGPLNLVEE
jgi:hypothetical protein